MAKFSKNYKKIVLRSWIGKTKIEVAITCAIKARPSERIGEWSKWGDTATATRQQRSYIQLTTALCLTSPTNQPSDPRPTKRATNQMTTMMVTPTPTPTTTTTTTLPERKQKSGSSQKSGHRRHGLRRDSQIQRETYQAPLKQNEKRRIKSSKKSQKLRDMCMERVK